MEQPTDPVLGRCPGRGWVSVTQGVHRPVSDISGLTADLRAWTLVLPEGACFTHLTAAAQRGWWLPPLPHDLPVFAAGPAPHGRPRRPGLRFARHPHAPAGEAVDGIPLAEPAEVLLACARDVELLDLTVLIDGALAAGDCSYDDVAAVARPRRRGAPRLRDALRHADARSESAWETLLRILHEVCEVRVQPQYDVLDADGTFLGTADLWLEGTTALHEYDGSDHLDRRRHRKDLQRDRRLGNGAWTRRGYTSHEVLMQAVSILRDADLSLGRPHRPERIRAWHDLLSRSLFTPSGTELFRRRLELPADPTLLAGRPDDAA